MFIKVLVVDDSLFMRTLVRDLLDSDAEIKVIGTAKSGQEALEKIPILKPDCITLDLAMPGEDGLETLKHIMTEHPTPCVILSAYSKKDADITMECLRAGAISYVSKPSGEISLNIEDVKQELLKEVKIAAQVDMRKIKSAVKYKLKQAKSKVSGINKVVIIGASTGGPQLLESILPKIPANLSAPIIVIQHIGNSYFIESLVEYLNKICALVVKVAEQDELLIAGKVYFAVPGFRLEFYSRNNNVYFSLNETKENILKPNINVTMLSCAKMFHQSIIGIILSGMGKDGLDGMMAIKKQGGTTIVQDESSLIFGMPKAVIDAGIADQILSADKIADAIIKLVNQ